MARAGSSVWLEAVPGAYSKCMDKVDGNAGGRCQCHSGSVANVVAVWSATAS